jgi:hypothetical protein
MNNVRGSTRLRHVNTHAIQKTHQRIGQSLKKWLRTIWGGISIVNNYQLPDATNSFKRFGASSTRLARWQPRVSVTVRSRRISNFHQQS